MNGGDDDTTDDGDSSSSAPDWSIEEETTSDGEGEDSAPTRPVDRYFGSCALPTTPARDTEISRDSGLRFGTRPVTYLEFSRKLRVRKRSDFSIKFKTTETDGIIFYVANDRSVI